MKGVRHFLLAIVLMCYNQSIGQGVEMADGMRSNGKIYVVVVIVLLILATLFFYLLRLDKKLAKLESEKREDNNS